jgi:hypothetical protein
VPLRSQGRADAARPGRMDGVAPRRDERRRRSEAQIAKIGHVRVGELGFAQQEGETKARANEPGGCSSPASVQGPGEAPRYLRSKTRRST